MSAIRTNLARRSSEHFEPQVSDDPQVQKRIRAHLEQIDYTAFAANREILSAGLGSIDTAKIQHLAVAAAQARADWVRKAMNVGEDGGNAATPEQIQQLARARMAFEELSAAYEGLRRVVERGYVAFQTLTPR